MRGPYEAEGKLGTQLRGLLDGHRFEEVLAILRFFERGQRQCRIVLRHLPFVVVGGVFFLQVPGIGQHN